MAVFEYRGILAASGKQVKAVRDAENAKALRAVLRKEGVLLTSAAEVKQGAQKAAGGRSLELSFIGRPSSADLGMATRQLATLIKAGIPLFESLGALSEQVENERLRRSLTAVREKVREGISLAKALEEQSDIFSSLYVNMVRAGEASGTLDKVLVRLVGFLEAQAKLKSKVGSALAYPALMVLIGTALVSVLMVAVVPNVVTIFASMNQALPWYTQLLIFVSNTVSSYGWLVPIVGPIAFFLFRRWKATPSGRYTLDSILLRVPIFGPLLRRVAVARFSRTLSTLLGAGVPLLQAMDIVRSVLENARLERVVVDATTQIREGQSIAEPLKKSGEFPPIVTHMIAVGERSGELEGMLENVADAYDVEVEAKVQVMTSLLEPLIIVTMGAIVGFIAVAILMPLMQLSSFTG